ncbi:MULTISPECIES: SCO family protein [Pandoraea]|uniref:Cytochrome c oxidase assembly protein n=1 Tax=Pandoraea pnomenusa TaxID=93220 RepID=A0ABY6WE46_9BURK|nr:MULTISPECIES: SCO family protein [Pandoraea]AHB07545.1 photosynthetic protein synthase I [Pandoraea pnomenusa 3kgm]AHB76264.1 cytochrome c oxidase assembly protein [Pandoraea pnomenusa]ANC45155.1 cytochrome c oxidase assembly protein [Pandoraea pnomenusa]MBN9093472.1 SCO family protein [Pandoraea pnomenusa]QDH58261.1 SCO family protein [Pandoraea pnomenusa]
MNLALIWSRRALLLLGLSVLLAACGKEGPTFQSLDITGNKEFAQDFSLQDPQGKTRTLADYKGRAVVMFFGYTHCPDVCPTTMAELNQVMQKLGPDDAKRVQVIFVTVDPQRDTPELMGQYVPAFNPAFVGLRPADDAALKALTKSFRVVVNKVEGSTPTNYTIDHTAGIYVFDPNGQLRLFMRPDEPVDAMAKDLKTLLS